MTISTTMIGRLMLSKPRQHMVGPFWDKTRIPFGAPPATLSTSGKLSSHGTSHPFRANPPLEPDAVDSCFLCNPDEDLVIGVIGPLRLVAGLGPITSTYVVIGTIQHIRCMADAVEAWPDLIQTLTEVREWLERLDGNFLICEHGRIPVCSDEEAPIENLEHDPHCYHAHALAFNTTEDIEECAKSYFLYSEEFSRLDQ